MKLTVKQAQPGPTPNKRIIERPVMRVVWNPQTDTVEIFGVRRQVVKLPEDHALAQALAQFVTDALNK